MNKLSFALLAGTMMLAPAVSRADSEHAAVVITNESCVVQDGDGNIVQATAVDKVITNSKNGNVLLKCQAKDVANSTGKAVQYDSSSTNGGKCMVIVNGMFVSTDQWHETLSADGRATLVCQVSKQP